MARIIVYKSQDVIMYAARTILCPIVDGVSRRNNHAERQGEPVLPLSAERALLLLTAKAPKGPEAVSFYN